MEYYEVEVDCMQYCYGGSAKFTVDPNGYGEWAKRADVELLIADRDRLAAENAELRYWKQGNIRCAATLRAHYDAAYLAALGGSAISDTADRDVRNADALALESVRTHAERMRKLERLIEEVANG